ncbi:MAG: ABC transporter permease [Bacilli bacterium]|nr:ABC transporter permease [Bacilli bacterium]
MKRFKELWQYREFLRTNVKKDIRGKYKASFLGVLWSFINPLLQVLVYAIVFPYIMRVQTPHYLVFLICGIIPWTWFITSLTNGTTCITINNNLIKKVYFPREILPISSVTSGMINFFISCLIILIFALIDGVGISWHIVFLPLIAIIQYLVQLTIVFLTSSFNVYVKDVEYMVTFLLNLAFYATPILYNVDMFKGSKFSFIFKINPVAHIVEAYRSIFYAHQIPQLRNLFILFCISLVMLFVCYGVFKKLEKRFAEEI